MAIKTASSSGLNNSLSSGLVLLSTQSFSGAGSYAINSVFNATYNNYQVWMDVTPSTSSSLQVRFKTSTDDTSSNYNIQHFEANTTTAVATRTLNDSVININKGPIANRHIYILEIFNPNAVQVTNGFIRANVYMNELLSSFYVNTDTQYTGFNLIPSTGTISGQAKIYGYN